MGALGPVLRDCRSRGKPLDSALEVKLWWLWPWSGIPRPVPGIEYEDEFAVRRLVGRIDLFSRGETDLEMPAFAGPKMEGCFARREEEDA
jgi:hypothetical protein